MRARIISAAPLLLLHAVSCWYGLGASDRTAEERTADVCIWCVHVFMCLCVYVFTCLRVYVSTKRVQSTPDVQTGFPVLLVPEKLCLLICCKIIHSTIF